jgi:hypothetical protein
MTEFEPLFLGRLAEFITGNPEVIRASVGLVPTNGHVFIDTVSHGREVGFPYLLLKGFRQGRSEPGRIMIDRTTTIQLSTVQLPSKTSRFLVEFGGLSRVRSTESSGLWSGRWESNPRPKLGKLLFCH